MTTHLAKFIDIRGRHIFLWVAPAFVGVCMLGNAYAGPVKGQVALVGTNQKAQKSALKKKGTLSLPSLRLAPQKKPRAGIRPSPLRLAPMTPHTGTGHLPLFPQNALPQPSPFWQKYGMCWDLRDRRMGWCTGPLRRFTGPFQMVPTHTFFRGEPLNTSIRLRF